MHSTIRRPRLAALLASALALAPAAHAAETCTGTIGTSLLHPLPSPLVIAAERPLQDAPNPELTQRFVAGMRAAGAELGQSGNVTASMSAEVTPPTSALATRSRGPSRTYSNFDWMMGEPGTSTHPDMTGSVLMMSMQLMDNASATISWLATIQCTIQTNDAGALAEELGRAIGGAVGKGYVSRPL